MVRGEVEGEGGRRVRSNGLEKNNGLFHVSYCSCINELYLLLTYIDNLCMEKNVFGK
jgi:hypothetical protein